MSCWAHFRCIAFVLVAAVGCGSTAAISIRGGGVREGEIVAGDENNIYLQQTGGGSVAVPRSWVDDVDHPGNVAATIGGILIGYGIANIIIGAPKCKENGNAFCVGVFTPAALGLGLTVYGLTTWYGSTKAMNTDRRGRRVMTSRFVLTPTYAYADGKGGPGLVLSSSF